jgi:hypothetical protein
MGDPNKPFSLDKPEVGNAVRRRDKVVSDAPLDTGIVPPDPPEDVERRAGPPRPAKVLPDIAPSEARIGPHGSRPPEDGGVDQHPIHDSDAKDLGPDDFQKMADPVEKTGIRSGRR